MFLHDIKTARRVVVASGTNKQNPHMKQKVDEKK